MQSVIDFLDFRLFISPYVLIACYYIGAVMVPLGSWFAALWVKQRFGLVSDIYEAGKKRIKGVTRTRDRALLYTLFATFFIAMEIMWRMMFEFLLAYLQIREALLRMAGA